MATNNAPAAKPANIVRAANIVAKHGMAGQARAIAATGAAAASAKRYGRSLGSLPAKFAATTFALTPAGNHVASIGGCIGAQGQATVMGLFAVALANAIAANGGQPATGQQVCLAMLGNPQLMAAAALTKARGTHLIPANATAMGWAAGYVNGLCRNSWLLGKRA